MQLTWKDQKQAMRVYVRNKSGTPGVRYRNYRSYVGVFVGQYRYLIERCQNPKCTELHLYWLMYPPGGGRQTYELASYPIVRKLKVSPVKAANALKRVAGNHFQKNLMPKLCTVLGEYDPQERPSVTAPQTGSGKYRSIDAVSDDSFLSQ